MEAVIFVVKAMAGAILTQSAKDSYTAVRSYLKDKLGLSVPVAALEENPDGETEQKLLAERIANSGALNHPEFCEKVWILVDALKEAKDVSPQASILIKDIKANEATFRNIHAEGSAGVIVTGVDAKKLTVDNVTAKS